MLINLTHSESMLPLKKRPYRGNTYSVSKRLKKVERLARSNKPEIKSITFVAAGTITTASKFVNVDCTNIAEGTKANERVGDQILIHRIEVRGLIDPDIDAHILKCYSSSKPTDANYTSGIGTFLLDSEIHSKFREILHYRNGTSIEDFNSTFSVNRKLGYKCYYNGSGAGTAQRGGTIVSLISRNSSDKNYAFTVRLYYSDA